MNRIVSASPGVPSSRRLLLLGCAKAKSTQVGHIPALQRYDGPAFRVVRRYLRLNPTAALDIHILSAEFGLIPADQPIPHYDRRMTPQRARALRPQVLAALDVLLSRIEPGEARESDVLFVLSESYLLALRDPSEPAAHPLPGRIAAGSQGRKLSILHDWLYGTFPKVATTSQAQDPPQRFRGMPVALAKEDVLAIVRQRLGDGPPDAFALTAWVVEVDGRRIAPKWLVGQVTGLPVSRFTTRDALGLLARLGIVAERV